MVRLSLWVLAWLPVFWGSASAADTDARARFRASRLLLSDGETQAGLQQLHTYLFDHPGDADAWFELGKTHYDLREYSKAEADFTRAIRLDPAIWNYWEGRAYNRYAGLNDYNGANADYIEAEALNPTQASLPQWRGIALMEAARYTDAAAAFTRLIALDPANTRTFLDRAEAYALAKRDDDAIKDLESWLAMASSRGNPSNYAARSLLHGLRKERRLQSALLHQWRNDERDVCGAWHRLGSAYLARGLNRTAAAALTEAVHLCPEFQLPLRDLASAQYNSGDWCGLEQSARLAVLKFPDQSWARRIYAQAMSSQASNCGGGMPPPPPERR